MDIMTIFACFAVGAVFLLLLSCLAISAVLPGIERGIRSFFIVYHSIIVAGMLVTLVDFFIYANPDYAAAEKAMVFFEHFLYSLLPPLVTAYLLRCCGEDWRSSVRFRAACAIWCLPFLMLCVNQFIPCFYYITPENLYYQTSWYVIMILPHFGAVALNLALLGRGRDNLSKSHFLAFLICDLVFLAFLTVQIFTVTVMPAYVSVVICSLAMCIIMVSDQLDLSLLQQREIANQRACIMVLKMRPHFIYNTMTSIYYLCEQDPEKAKQVTLDFTAYLRQNFNAIASQDPISFSAELEHTRAYLAVEQAQFEDMLSVDYDIPHIRFRIPPLTLQPLVENAVKHGMDMDSGPLHISIRTRKTDSGSVIAVEDNGSGFDCSAAFLTQGTLSNIRQRLELLCRGKIEIASREDSGTVVTVTIPD